MPSCIEPADEAAAGEQRLVIDGYIDSDGEPEVILTLSANPEVSTQLSDCLIKWGKVTVSDGIDTVILTGGRTNKRFPPYHYHSLSLCGTPGRTYTITAEYDGLTASAKCTMPMPTPIDGVSFTPRADGSMDANISFTAPTDCPAYYRIYTRLIGADSTYYPSRQGVVRADIPGQRITVPIHRGRQDITDHKAYTSTFPTGELVGIKLCRISPEVYRFFHEFENISIFGGGMILNITSPLPSNISSGYGVWSAQGVDVKVCRVE